MATTRNAQGLNPREPLIAQPRSEAETDDQVVQAVSEIDELLDALDLLDSQGPRVEITDDPAEAVAEGLAYVPPSAPPVVSDEGSEEAQGADNVELASGDEPYTSDHHAAALPADDEVATRVREAFRADSSSALFADHVHVNAHGGVVTLRGEVDDLEDDDNLVAVAAGVAGVGEVVDELRVRSIEGSGTRRPPSLFTPTTTTVKTAPSATSPLTAAELASFGQRLEAMRQSLRARIDDLEAQLATGDEEAEADNAPADDATELYDREQALGLLEALQAEHQQVERALARIAAGTYGLSEVSGRVIPLARLDALPSATTLVGENRSHV